MRMIILILSMLFITACTNSTEPEIKTASGTWRLTIAGKVSDVIIASNKENLTFAGVEYDCPGSLSYYCQKEVGITTYWIAFDIYGDKINGWVEVWLRINGQISKVNERFTGYRL